MKLELAMARACMNSDDLTKAANLPRPTLNNVITGRNIRPATIGKVARALGVDVADLIESEV
nr:helix-turn-helix transcriptional regulator [Clostridium sp. MSTE9]